MGVWAKGAEEAWQEGRGGGLTPDKLLVQKY